MCSNYKPTGVNTANVYLLNKNVPALIRFVESVFGGEVKQTNTRTDGSIKHVEIKLEDSIIMAGEVSGEQHACPAAVYVYVPDCDAAYTKALEQGAVSVMLPKTGHDVHERYGGVKDCNGNIWWIATHNKDFFEN